MPWPDTWSEEMCACVVAGAGWVGGWVLKKGPGCWNKYQELRVPELLSCLFSIYSFKQLCLLFLGLWAHSDLFIRYSISTVETFRPATFTRILYIILYLEGCAWDISFYIHISHSHTHNDCSFTNDEYQNRK